MERNLSCREVFNPLTHNHTSFGCAYLYMAYGGNAYALGEYQDRVMDSQRKRICSTVYHTLAAR